MTLSEALNYGTDKIGRRDAMLLLSHVTGYSKSRIRIYVNEAITKPARAEYLKCLERCARNEPIQYIIGKWEFMGLELNVDKRALIPRPETELLVEEAVKFIKSRASTQGGSKIKVLDVCTGSGCIALAIAHMCTDAEVIAVDISRDALSLAKENAAKLNLFPNHQNFIESDLIEQLLNRSNEKFDVVISNPPYIPSGEIAGLSANVCKFEPRLALDGGVDGMDIYRRLIPQSISVLKPGGALFLEIGPVAVANLMAGAGFSDISLIRDYAGLERIITGVKKDV